MVVERIVSGGQTGVDRGALDAALELGIPCGGWCPAGRRAEDGSIPDHYPLQETAFHNYNKRTRLNVQDSDATLILSRGELEGGTAYTLEVVKRLNRPYLVVGPESPTACWEIQAWLEQNKVRELNVAGPRESKCPGIQRRVCQLLAAVFKGCAT